MSDEIIGKSEVTWELVNALENLADAQQQCEAQFVAAVYHKRALDDRRVDVSKAFDACRKFECLDVDKMMEQKFVVTSQMIDAYRAELLGQTSAPVSSDADELNDLTPHEGEEEGEPEHASDCSANNAPAYEAGECDCDVSDAEAQPVEQEAEPDPAPESVPEPIEAKPHVEDAISEIEAQAEPESTEPEADYFVLDANGLELRVGDSAIASFSRRNSGRIFEITEIVGDEVIGEEGMFTSRLVERVEKAEPDTAETMQAIAEAVEAVDAEPEAMMEIHPIGGQSNGDSGLVDVEGETQATPDETVTEQPETVEAEPETPTEPKAERKTLDCTGDYTEEEIRAKSGFDPRVQSDDIAAVEREEFNRPRVHNPWFTAKAEG